MITKLDIEKFGLFENCKWEVEIGKQETFRRLNIIYGRNYSGKTTLSRILKCVEDKQLHNNYLDAKFNINFTNDKNISQNNLQEELQDYKIRVYNSDFVKKNLSWLHNEDGTINPFTILGAKNVELDNQIKEIETSLGSIEEGKESGLMYQAKQAKETYEQKKSAHDRQETVLNNLLIEQAKKIKNSAIIYNVPTYQINTIKKDIPNAQQQLTDDVITEKRKLLNEEPKETLTTLREIKPQFKAYYNQANELLKKQIKPSEPITELINDSLLQEWVRQGIDKHKDKRITCAFCGSSIDKSLWDKLDAHFSKESEELRQKLKTKKDQLDQAKNNLSSFFTLSKEQFYSNFAAQFDTLQKQWNATIKTYSESMDTLISELSEREKDIFRARELGNIADVSQTVLETIQEINKLIASHNQKTQTLSDDQEAAREQLRYSEIAKFLATIDYENKKSEIAELQVETTNAKSNFDSINSQITELNEKKRTLEAQSKDESKGAELVNNHLQHFFGHNELKLVAEGTAPNIRFKIIRDNQNASNLSEGECSLISFCYFIARMEDELNNEVDSKKLIIYIDDPISSLDSNHIFFMFSLIESVIAKPQKYCQLFISTHNLDFLKYLKQLTFPKYKPPTAEAENKKQDRKHFLIERNGKSKITLKLAPEYLKNYITEFNYLFYQIFRCSTSENQRISEDYQYNFGNNMRKFLEAYLFYKYPSDKLSFDERIKKFFNDDISYSLVRRVVNEYSHLEDRFERGLKPVDVNEIKQIAQKVLDTIKTNDKDQYNALIESIKNEI